MVDKSPQQVIAERFNYVLLEHSPQLRKCGHAQPGEKVAIPWKQYGGALALNDTPARIDSLAKHMARTLEDHLHDRNLDPYSMDSSYKDGLVCLAPYVQEPRQIFTVLYEYQDVSRGTLFFIGAQFSALKPLGEQDNG